MEYLDLDGELRYREAAFRVFEPGEHHVTRIFDRDVLLFVLEGVLRFAENGCPVEVSSGEYYVQREGLQQTAPLPSEEPRYMYVHFNGTWGEEGLPRRGYFSPGELLPLLEQLENYEQSPSATRADRQMVFFTLLHRLSAGQKSEENDPLAERIRRELWELSVDPAPVSELALRLHYSEDYLIRVFRRCYGITPGKYLRLCRVERAEQLLLSTGRSLEKIAQDCGFGDVSGFYRAFMAVHGQSPGLWRRLRLGGTKEV